ncbi:glucose dehydrogenase [FAD, quinone]-like [Centruroides sculpturatus]|uniref:glucose dehydrogenase [FAD, quinone]-like n=1 Tax=Centruroides sculpturatus TaxID=218467 RepID=UPI000C6E6771|nr:glucose dehydrogenase [FAD, quinone]-like [Centruroides sculpturatus]
MLQLKFGNDWFSSFQVGSGSAGSVLTNRLSHYPSINVLLLEAGERPPLIPDINLLHLDLIFTKHNWHFSTVPSSTIAHARKRRSFNIAASKILGGSPMHIHNVYVRGNRKDYDNWAKNGSIGWDCTEGELVVQYPPFFTSLVKGYLEAAEELGYHMGDVNGMNQSVFMPSQGTIVDGRKWTTYQAFIKPIEGRRNLRIITSAFVTKILIDDHNRAYGVLFDYCNQTYKVLARQEVIISAGTFNSPKLLMLSGIGRKEILKKFHIPVRTDLPVGENLHDHVSTLGLQFVTNSSTFRETIITKRDYEEMLINGAGLLTSLGIEVIGFMNSKYNEDPEWPDIEIVWASRTASSDTSLRKIAGAVEELEKIFEEYSLLDTITCSSRVTRPKSRGLLTLKSNDPYDNPVIDLNLLSNYYDVKISVEGMKFCLQLASTKAMKRYSVRPLSYIIPGCEKYKLYSDKYLECMLIAFPLSAHHFVGTCKMGHPNDPSIVVDNTLKVKGIYNLRVIV